MNWIIEYIPHIISIIAIVLSILSFYYIYLQGPKFRFEHISWNLQGTSVDTQYRHTIAVINDGNKSGLIWDIDAKTKSETYVKIQRVEIIRGSKRFELTENKKSIAVGPKESVILLVDSNLSNINVNKGDKIPEYCIEILYDKSIGLDIYKRKKCFKDEILELIKKANAKEKNTCDNCIFFDGIETGICRWYSVQRQKKQPCQNNRTCKFHPNKGYVKNEQIKETNNSYKELFQDKKPIKKKGKK